MLRAEVYVTLKPVVNDPAGLTIRSGLHSLGFDNVADVRAGKYLVLTLDDDDEATARGRVEEMARQLLANEVIEDYRIVLLESSTSRDTPSPSRADIPSPARGGGQGGGL